MTMIQLTCYEIARAFYDGARKSLQVLFAIITLVFAVSSHAIDIRNGITLTVHPVVKNFGGNNITFWVYCQMGPGMMPGNCMDSSTWSPLLEIGVGQQANVTLMVPMMMANEPAPYDGHTIHFHGLDLPQGEDGVPETGASTNGDTYTFTMDARYIGSHKYHCHVHTVKHLEMGMYGGFIVRAVDEAGNFVNRINDGGPFYDFEWNWVLSTVDPRYHTAIGDDPVFASYEPQYFLINGNTGLSRTTPAETLIANTGSTVAIRLMGLQSVNATFRILDLSNNPQTFQLHNMDGFKLNTPRNETEIEISPGQTRDIMITLPAAGGVFYPEITYRRLLDDSPYSTVYSTLVFN